MPTGSSSGRADFQLSLPRYRLSHLQLVLLRFILGLIVGHLSYVHAGIVLGLLATEFHISGQQSDLRRDC